MQLKKILSDVDRVVGKLSEKSVSFASSVSPLAVFLVFFFFGTILLALSTAIGIDHLTINDPDFRGAYDHGYFNSINWSFNYSVFVPITLTLMVMTYQSIESSIREMANEGMIFIGLKSQIIDNKVNPVDGDKLLDLWRKKLEKTVRLNICISAFIFLVVMAFDFYPSCLGPLFINSSPGNWGGNWQSAALIASEDGAQVNRYANAVFGLFAYFYEWIIVSSVVTLALIAKTFADWTRNFTDFQNDDQEIIPNVKYSFDKRYGFQVFGTFSMNLTICGLSLFFVIFSTRLDAIYQHPSRYKSAESDAPKANRPTNVTSFYQEDVLIGFMSGVKEMGKEGWKYFSDWNESTPSASGTERDKDHSNIFDFGQDGGPDIGVILVGLGYILFVFMIIAIPFSISNHTAYMSQLRYRKLLRDGELGKPTWVESTLISIQEARSRGLIEVQANGEVVDSQKRHIATDLASCSKWKVTDLAVKEMQLWPMNYMKQTTLITFCFLAGFCFFYYKFSFILFGIMAYTALKRFNADVTSMPSAS